MRTLTFFSVGDWGGGGATALFTHFGHKKVDSPAEADVIILNGGADIATSIYGERSVVRGVPEDLSARDIQELKIYEEFKDDESKFFFGICRGAQLLNCLNGGTLFQHVDNHQRSHDMICLITGAVMQTTSTHHQQMRLPADILNGGEVIAISSESSIKIAEDGEHRPTPNPRDLKHGEDLEIVWYTDTRCLCIQGHPEYNPQSEFSKYCLGLLDRFYGESVKCAA